jgi:hypothetical protein
MHQRDEDVIVTTCVLYISISLIFGRQYEALSAFRLSMLYL